MTGLKQSFARWLAFIFAINLSVGLLFCFAIYPRLSDTTSGLDPDGYGAAGRDLYEKGQFTTITKAPGYPVFIALVSWIVRGYQPRAIQAAQCLLAALTCVVLYLIFLNTLESEPQLVKSTGARLASLACALYPMTVWYTPRLWTETFLAFLIAVYTLTLVRLLKKPSASRALICGIAMGAAALSKGIALVFFPLTILILLVYYHLAGVRWAIYFSAAALLLITPWTIRNYTLTGALLPIHTDGGLNFYLGNGFARHWLEAPFSYADLKQLTVADMETLYQASGVRPADTLAEDRMLLKAALQELWAEPGLILRKLAIQSLTFWYLAADYSKSLLTGSLQIPVVLLALPGILKAARRRDWSLLLLAPIAGIMGVSVTVFAFARLSATIMPYMIAFAVYFLFSRWIYPPEEKSNAQNNA